MVRVGKFFDPDLQFILTERQVIAFAAPFICCWASCLQALEI
jgi:hypothetical protein